MSGCGGVLPTRKRRRSSRAPGETGDAAWIRALVEDHKPWNDPGPGGVTYLLHFDTPYEHARHYTGWAKELNPRLKAHRAGRGANLIRVITAAGISFTLARTWPGTTREWEAKLKRRGGAVRHCPICNPRSAMRRAQVPPDGPFRPLKSTRSAAAPRRRYVLGGSK